MSRFIFRFLSLFLVFNLSIVPAFAAMDLTVDGLFDRQDTPPNTDTETYNIVTLKNNGTIVGDTIDELNANVGFDLQEGTVTGFILGGTGGWLQKTTQNTVTLNSTILTNVAVLGGILELGSNADFDANNDTYIYLDNNSGEGANLDINNLSDTVRYISIYNGAVLNGTGTLSVTDDPDFAEIYLKNGAVVNANLGGTLLKNTAILVSGGGSANTLNGEALVGIVAIVDGSTLQLGNSERIDDGATLFVNQPNSKFDLNGNNETVKYVNVYNSAILESSGATGTLYADQYVLNSAILTPTVILGGNATNDSALFAIGGTNVLYNTVRVASARVDGGATLQLAGAGTLYNTAVLVVDGENLAGGSTFDLNGKAVTIANVSLYNSAVLKSSIAGGSLAADQYVLKNSDVTMDLPGNATYNSALFVIGGTNVLYNTVRVASARVDGGATLQLGAGGTLYNTAVLVVDGENLAGGSTFDLNGQALTIDDVRLYNSAVLKSTIAGGSLAADQYVLKNSDVTMDLPGNATYNSALYVIGGTNVLYNSVRVASARVDGASTLQLGAGGTLYNTAVLLVEGGSTFDLNGQVLTIDDVRIYNSAVLASTLPGGSLSANQYVLKNSDVTMDLPGNTAQDSGLYVIGGTNVLYNTVRVASARVDGGSILQLGPGGMLSGTQVLLVDGSTFDLNGQALTIGDVRLYNSAVLASTLPGGSLSANQYVLKNAVVRANLTGNGTQNSALYVIGGANVLYNNVRVGSVSINGGATLQLGSGGTLSGTQVLLVDGSTFDLNGQALTIGDVRLYNRAVLTSTQPGGSLSANQYVLKNSDVTMDLPGNETQNSALYVIGGTNVLYNSVRVGSVSIDGGATLQLGVGGTLSGTQVLLVDGSTFDLNGQSLTIGDVRLYNSAVLASTLPGGSLSADQYVLKNSDVTMDLPGNGTQNSALYVIGGTNVLYKSVAVGSANINGGSTLKLGTGGSLLGTEVLLVEGAGSTFDLNGRALTISDVRLYNSAVLASTLPGGSLSADQYVLKNSDVRMALPGNATRNSALYVIGGTNVLYNPIAVASASITNGSVVRLVGNELLNHYNSSTFADDLQLYIDNSTLDLQGYDETVKYASFYNGSSLKGSGSLAAEEYILKGSDIHAFFTGDTTYNAALFVTGGTNTIYNTATVKDVSLTNGGVLVLAKTDSLQTYNSVTMGYEPMTRVVMNSATLELQEDQTFGALAGSGNILLGGQLTTGGSDDSSEFSGTISGNGGLVKEGAGYFILSGVNSYSGSTRVNEGHLVVNGIVASDVDVGADGNLWGAGSVNGLVTNNGKVFPGNSIGTLTVDDFVSNVGSVLAIEFDGFGNSDRLIVNNLATLNGGVLEFYATGNGEDYSGRQYRYTFLEAGGGITGTFDDVTSNVPEFTPELLYSSSGMQVRLTRNDIDFGSFANALTENHSSVGDVLTRISAEVTDGELNDLLNNFVEDWDVSERRRALDQIGGQKIYTAVPVVSMGLLEAFNGAIGQRIRLLHQQYGSESAEQHPMDRIIFSLVGEVAEVTPVDSLGQKSHNFWVHLYGNDGKVDSDSYSAGYDYTLSGAAMGFDFVRNDSTSLGVSLGYGVADLNTTERDNADIQGLQFGMYGSYESYGFYVDGLVSLALNNQDVHRSIRFGDYDEIADADFDSYELSMVADIGSQFEVAGLTMLPFLGTSYILSDEESFTEKGAGVLGLKAASGATKSWKIIPGLTLQKMIPFEKGFFLPEIRMRLVRELAESQSTFSASLVGAPDAGNFSVRGVDVDRNSVEVDVGFKLSLWDRLQVKMLLGAEINENKSEHKASGGLQYLW